MRKLWSLERSPSEEEITIGRRRRNDVLNAEDEQAGLVVRFFSSETKNSQSPPLREDQAAAAFFLALSRLVRAEGDDHVPRLEGEKAARRRGGRKLRDAANRKVDGQLVALVLDLDEHVQPLVGRAVACGKQVCTL